MGETRDETQLNMRDGTGEALPDTWPQCLKQLYQLISITKIEFKTYIVYMNYNTVKIDFLRM